jgi:hypothetical protein
MDRNHSVINSFEIVCNLEVPDFSHIESRATAMEMNLQKDESKRSANGTITRHEAWLGRIPTGPFVLLLDRMDGSKGTATSCAITAQVPDPDAFRVAAIETMKLPPDTTILGQTGVRSSEWRGVSGPGTTLILRDISKAGGSTVMVKLVSMRLR